MKRIVLLSICLLNACFTFGQAGEAVYTISGDDFNVKSKFIEAFPIEQGVTLAPYAFKKSETVFTSSVYGNFSLDLYRFRNYENDPGEYNVIALMKNGVKVLELKSSDGFERISKHAGGYTRFFSLIGLTTNTYALVFTGPILASQPPMLSVVLIRNGQAKLVYNKPMYINSISNSSGSFSMQLQANTVEYVNPNTPDIPANEAELHTLWWDGATLRFQ